MCVCVCVCTHIYIYINVNENVYMCTYRARGLIALHSPLIHPAFVVPNSDLSIPISLSLAISVGVYLRGETGARRGFRWRRTD